MNYAWLDGRIKYEKEEITGIRKLSIAFYAKLKRLVERNNRNYGVSEEDGNMNYTDCICKSVVLFALRDPGF
jgi:hypothetical protein